MTATRKIAPSVRVLPISFAKAKEMFGNDVKKDLAYGQRDPKLRKQSGLGHVTGLVELPSTQAVLQAVEYRGEAAAGVPLKLIDGYRRLNHWMDQDDCPFETLFIIVHTIQADTKEDINQKTEALASTIDNRKAVKTKADRWCAAVREAGIRAKSNVYTFGNDMHAYLEANIGTHRLPMAELVEAIKQKATLHLAMDEMFAFAENHLSVTARRNLLHPGISNALFAVTEQHGLKVLKVARSALMYSAGYVWEDAPEDVKAMASRLNWISASDTKANHKTLCNSRKEFYQVTCATLRPSLAAIFEK